MFKLKDLCLLVLLSLFVIQPFFLVNALIQPYTGAWTTGTKTSTSKVVFGLDFSGTTPSSLPSGKFIGAPMSVAGGIGTTGPGTDMYQTFHSVKNTGIVSFTPQIWRGSNYVWLPTSIAMNTYTSYLIFARMEWVGTTVYFKSYEYRTITDFERDTPNIISTPHLRLNTDTNFLVGSEVKTVGGLSYTMKYLQHGAEANTNSSSIDWRIHNGWLSYYSSGAWRCLPGKSVDGIHAGLSIYNNEVFGVGGITMYSKIITTPPPSYTCVTNEDNTSKYTSQTDLWANTGIMTPPVNYPFT